MEPSSVRAHVTDGHDVGMIQVRRSAGFGQIRFGIFRFLKPGFCRYFDGDLSVPCLCAKDSAIKVNSFAGRILPFS